MVAEDGGTPVSVAPDSDDDVGVRKVPRREGLARITVRAHGRSSSISMDALLYRILIDKMGSGKAVQNWAQKVVLEVEELDARGVVMPPRDVKASLSRLVQRQALRTLWHSEV